ncbi:hypothetical protein INT48_001291, partial [Thamnidium elegans]
IAEGGKKKRIRELATVDAHQPVSRKHTKVTVKILKLFFLVQISMVLLNVNLDIPFSLVEVFGSLNNPSDNYNHYKGDRSKLAKNFKYLLKVTISMKGIPSFKSACKIKLFGIHIYYDQVYVYSMSMPMWGVFVFKPESKFDIPINPALFSSALPTFISKLFQLRELLDHFSSELEVFLSVNDYESSSSFDNDKSTLSNQMISRNKRKHYQRS